MRKYPGLIPGPQTLIGFQKPYWKYGNIINGNKQIDPVLHFGCFVLGFDRWDIVDYVNNNMKMKPEVAESFIMEDNLRLNDISWTLAEQLSWLQCSQNPRSGGARGGEGPNHQ